jgi:hypothetical protein
MKALSYFAIFFRILGNTVQRGINFFHIFTTNKLIWIPSLSAVCVAIYMVLNVFYMRTEWSTVIFRVSPNSDYVYAQHCAPEKNGKPETYVVEKSTYHRQYEITHRKGLFNDGNVCRIEQQGVMYDHALFTSFRNIVDEECNTPEIRQECAALLGLPVESTPVPTPEPKRESTFTPQPQDTQAGE